MFHFLLALHSIFRWIILLSFLITIVILVFNILKNKPFSKQNYRFLQAVCLLLNSQLIVGILLFYNSHLVNLFWLNFQEALKLRQPRFFGLEHPSMMILGVLLFNFFSFKMRNKINSTKANYYFLKCFLIILFIILSSIPWSFSPLTSRPDFRSFY